jgi:colanic acid biosynthesis glycosyl transferase WcaI
MKRIWVLTELYFPEKTSTAYFLTETAQGLATNHSITVVTGNSMYETQGVSLPKRETIQGVEVQRCHGTGFNKNRLIGKLCNGITRSLAIFFKTLWQCERSDVIFVVTNPPLLPLMALLLSWFKGCQFVLLVHDVYPEVLAASGLTKPHTMLYRSVRWINTIIYRNASYVVTLGRDMSRLVEAKLPKKQHSIVHCIPNWAETDSIYPLSRLSSLLQQLNLTDKFVVLYAGNMGRTHDLQILIDSAVILSAEQSPVHFLCVGAGAKKQWLQNQVKANGLDNVTVLSYLPHSEKNNVLNACDLGLISFMAGMAGVSVPSRMYNQMAAGKPLVAIAEDWSEIGLVIQEEQIGWVVPPGSCDCLVKVLRDAAANPRQCQIMGDKAAHVVQSKYALHHAVRSYQYLFDQLFGSSPRATTKVACRS